MRSHKNSRSHIDASHSRQPLVKGERLVRYEVNAVMFIDRALMRHVLCCYMTHTPRQRGVRIACPAVRARRGVQSHAGNCAINRGMFTSTAPRVSLLSHCWAEARIKIARMTLTIKLDRNWSSFQLANSAPPLSVTDSAIAPSARIYQCALTVLNCAIYSSNQCLG